MEAHAKHAFRKIPVALQAHLKLRPVGIVNAVRLYIGYLAALPMRFFTPRRFESMGYLIPGKSTIIVSVAGVLAMARPHTNDLAILVASHEPKTAASFRIKPGEIVVDVGAHIGRYTLSVAKLASRIVAIEPDPSNYFILQENIRLNGFSNIVALRLALSRSPGNLTLYPRYGANKGMSSLETKWSGWGYADSERPVEVQCETLDRLAASLRLESIDWLKIDVEGHEVSVLEGARSSLTKTKHLILEVSRGNEEACRKLLTQSGLTHVSIEQDPGSQASNWLLIRTAEAS